MAKPVITSEQLLKEVIKLSAEQPEKIYQRGYPLTNICSYVSGGDGEGCIMGQALVRLGVDPELLSHWEDAESLVDTTIQTLLESPSAPFTYEEEFTTDVFSQIQGKQDQSIPWRKCVLSAKSQFSFEFAGLNNA